MRSPVVSEPIPIIRKALWGWCAGGHLEVVQDQGNEGQRQEQECSYRSRDLLGEQGTHAVPVSVGQVCSEGDEEDQDCDVGFHDHHHP